MAEKIGFGDVKKGNFGKQMGFRKTSTITVGARDSLLSRAQVDEVLKELRHFHPHITFIPHWYKTTGDLDLKTSLRELDKTDFFTKEIDEAQLQGCFRVAIHSAKDLPEPLRSGLLIAAVTKGVDPSDSLVLREKETLFSLPPFARIATSSKRREAAVKELRPDLCFVDIRGSIDARLSHLDRGDIDGVVIAEAALVRLGWTHRNRLRLEVETSPLQGKLAILIREGDDEMKSLFAPLHGCAT